ncbi:RhoGAP-domain-containing protein [Piromyces finnis]|uniref:RhoGAP-domain-containing protein n=1 Tax=Piromyces finnis TaxID=1754191 RepID=A0A1Y1UZK8_9FUNG|nr:RhoGAP-domain-containing protein [Piromyces finnis]|eukprot:ORX43361.1 RhoGAP-domain-containing protein [Piromyces finnis]
MTEANSKQIKNINNLINLSTNNVQQLVQDNHVVNQQMQNEIINGNIQNIIAERDALRTQNASLWNIIEKQRNMIQKLQNQITLLQQQAQKKKGKHGEKAVVEDKDKKGIHHPLPEIPLQSSSQRGSQQRANVNSNSTTQFNNSTPQLQNAILNEKFIRKGSAPNIKDHEVIYDLKNRARSNSENAVIENTLNENINGMMNYEFGSENVNNNDEIEDRPMRTDSNGSYTPPHPERLSSSKINKNKPMKSGSTLSIPIQIDTVRVKVIGSLIKINEKGKEIITFIILTSKLTNSGTEENEKIEKSYADFVQLDSKLRSQEKILVAKMGKLPDKSLFNSNSPSKRDQRKIELELYLQNLISVFKNNKDLEVFLTTDVLETQINNQKNEISQSIKEGYLIKRGKNFGGWKTRYFILADNILSYYDNHGGNYGGVIKLKRSQVISLPNEDSDYRHGLMIMEYRKQSIDGPNEKATGKHILCAENDEERDEWVLAISQAIEAINQDDQADSEKNSNTVDKSKSIHTDNENIYDSMDDVEESVPTSLYSSNNSLQNGYQNQMYIPAQPMPISMKNKQQSISNSQSSSLSEFDFQKSGDFVDENERIMQQVVEPPFGIITATPPNSTPNIQKKTKKIKEEKKKRLWGRNKNKQSENIKVNGNKELVFGLSLAEAIAASKIKANYELPAVVYRCIEYLDANDAQNEEGIYRLSGSTSTIKALKDKFNNEGDYDLLNSDEYYDIHAVAGLLKLFLRELKEPILTRELQSKFLHIPELESRNQKIYELANLISLLPLGNYTLLRCLSAHLVRIVQNSSINKMTLHNVTIVFSPTLNIPAGVFMLLLSEFQIIFCWTNQQQLQQQLIPDEEQQKLYMAQQRMQQQMYSPKFQNKTISASNIQNIPNGQSLTGKHQTMTHSKTIPLMQNLSNFNNISNPSSSNSSLSQDVLPPKAFNQQINKIQSAEHSNRNSVSYMDGLPEHMKLTEMMAMKKGQKLEVSQFEDGIEILEIVDSEEE